MDGLTTLIALGVAIYFLESVGLFIVGWAIVVGYLFTVIQATSEGAERLPDPTDFQGIQSLVLPIVRFVVALSYIWLPALAYIMSGPGLMVFRDRGINVILEDPVLLAMMTVGACYFPVAMLVAAVSDSMLAVFDLRIGFRIVGRLPFEYLGAAAAALLLMVLGIVYKVEVALAARFFPVPFLPGLLAETVGVVFWILPGWVLGRLIYANHQHFGLLLQGQDRELEWPGAVPRAQPRAEGARTALPLIPPTIPGWEKPGLTRAADTMATVPADTRQIHAPRQETEAIEIEGWTDRPVTNMPPLNDLQLELSSSTPTVNSLSDDLVLEFEEEPATEVPALAASTNALPEPAPLGVAEVAFDDGAPQAATSVDSLMELQQALQSQQSVAALTAFVRCRDAGIPIALEPRLELRLATVLERAREFGAAVAACRRAADQDLTGPMAPRAIFMAARLYAEKLEEPARAGALYRYLVETYPSDDLAPLADEAARRLAVHGH